jgi:hypothetical protein
MADVTRATIPFLLRDSPGEISVEYGRNDNPLRWGHDVLGLDWFNVERVRGFPVVEATVIHPAEGYRAFMGWLQVLRYDVRDSGEEVQTEVVDVAPQLAEVDLPYLVFGIRPTLFDAPCTDATSISWAASSFLAYSPDAVMSKNLKAVCGFTWGFRVEDRARTLASLRVATGDDWAAALSVLTERFPAWTFDGNLGSVNSRLPE